MPYLLLRGTVLMRSISSLLRLNRNPAQIGRSSAVHIDHARVSAAVSSAPVAPATWVGCARFPRHLADRALLLQTRERAAGPGRHRARLGVAAPLVGHARA